MYSDSVLRRSTQIVHGPLRVRVGWKRRSRLAVRTRRFSLKRPCACSAPTVSQHALNRRRQVHRDRHPRRRGRDQPRRGPKGHPCRWRQRELQGARDARSLQRREDLRWWRQVLKDGAPRPTQPFRRPRDPRRNLGRVSGSSTGNAQRSEGNHSRSERALRRRLLRKHPRRDLNAPYLAGLEFISGLRNPLADKEPRSGLPSG